MSQQETSSSKYDHLDVLDRFQAKFTSTEWKDCSSKGKVSIAFVVSALVVFPIITAVAVRYLSKFEGVQESYPALVVSSKYEGTGGSDYTVLGDEFLMADDNYFCDEDLWRLNAGAVSTIMTYGSSTSLGQTFQYECYSYWN